MEAAPSDQAKWTEENPGRTRPRRGLITAVIVFAALLVLAISGYFYWQNYVGAADRWLSIRKMEGQETPIKDGKIFLVQGLVSNGSTKARKYVILKAKLFDRRGAMMAEHFALAGRPLSRDEVGQMSGSEIDRKVADFRLSSLARFVLQRDKALPFSIAFPDGYSGTPKTFTVEVIEAPPL
jgi:hypothetical protein